MNIEKIKDNIYWIGVKDPALRIFDIVMETKKGTTYNSYIIDDQKIAIVDTVKDKFYSEFLMNIKSVIGEKDVDYIVVQHTELDHTGALLKLLSDYPNAKVVGSKAALTYLKDILNVPFNSIEAKDSLELGETTLKFISAPNLHWPDTIFTYIQDKKFLFSCDFTGCHYCPSGALVDSYSEQYFEEMKYYFDVIMGPFKRFVNLALDKLSNLEIDFIAPSHGPIHIENPDKFLELYREWAKVSEVDPKSIPIFYVSAYGNTENIAVYIMKKLNEKGYNSKICELSSMDINEAVDIIKQSPAFILGSPTINGDAVKPTWDLLSLLSPIENRGKLAAAFGSFGWSGEGVNLLTERLKGLKLKTVEGFKFKFVPSKDDYSRCDEFIKSFLDGIK